jgi:hypothetical protein
MKNSFGFNLEKENDNDNNDNNNNTLLNDIKNISIKDKEKGNNFYIKNIAQYFDLKFKYNNNNNINIDFNSEKDILIKDKFLLAVLNLDILSDSQLSTVVLNIIDKESWSK